jgi:FkbM family methyltransferase
MPPLRRPPRTPPPNCGAVTSLRDRDALKVLLTRYPRLYDQSRRPYAAGRFWLRRPHDPDYGVFGLFPERHGAFLDVGANAGMSALSFRIYRSDPVVSVEPNPFHEPDLRFTSKLVRPLTYRMWAAGDIDGMLTLYVPVYRNVPLTTEASLLEEEVSSSVSLRARLGSRMDSEDFEISSRSVPVRRLDALGLDPAFVKLDVQGFEFKALLGLEKTLQRTHPVLLIETPGAEVRELLADLSYGAYTYVAEENRLVPERDPRTNTVFMSSAAS